MSAEEAKEKYKHKEAFCVMEYASDDGRYREFLWNSRDGVTPFVITSRNGKVQMRHINWETDMCIEDHEPKPGSRIFVTATPELVKPEVVKYIDKHWLGGLDQYYQNKEQAIEHFIKDWTRDGSPWIRTVE